MPIATAPALINANSFSRRLGLSSLESVKPSMMAAQRFGWRSQRSIQPGS
jgi:hypothetical protein